MMWWHGGWGWGPWAATTFSMLVFWALVIGAVVLLVRGLGDRSRSAGGVRTAEDLLAERYARGEIDDDEYRRRREMLRAPR